MDPLIERYIYDVTRRLPEQERGEVSRELETSIADMLPENPGDPDVVRVLNQMGAPSKLAEQYRQKPRYLISPALFDLYIQVLKTVAVTVGVVCVCAGAFLGLDAFEGNGFTVNAISHFTAEAIGMGVEGVLMAAFWVTVGFVVADHSGYKGREWKVSDLPRLPDREGVHISRSSTIVGMALSVFITGLYIAAVRGGWPLFMIRGSDIIYPFTQEAMINSIPYVIGMVCAAMVLNALKLIWAHWNVLICLANALHNVVWVSVMIFMLRWTDIWNPDFLRFMERFTSEWDVMSRFSTGGAVTVLSVAFIIIGIIDTLSGAWNTAKGLRSR